MGEGPGILRQHRRLITVLCAALWMGAFVATHVPLSGLPSAAPGDKILHLIGYFGLATGVLIALTAWGVSRRRRVLLAMTVLPLYAVLDEATQPLFGRGAEVLDWLMDVLATAAAVGVWEGMGHLRGRGKTRAEARR